VVSGQNLMYMAGGEYPDGSASQEWILWISFGQTKPNQGQILMD
jgi:hypothetical protein